LTTDRLCGIMRPVKAVTEKSIQGKADRETRPQIESLARKEPEKVRS